jgi:hypothetical protein
MWGDKRDHYYEMAKTSQDDKDVPYFMEAKHTREEIQLLSDVNDRTQREE